MASLILRLRRLHGELAYAQRRLLELQTGLCLARPSVRSRRHQREVAELDALWANAAGRRRAPLSPNVR